MTRHDHWRKASHSGQNGDCVALPGTLDAVRDTKNGATLPLTRHAVAALLISVKKFS